MRIVPTKILFGMLYLFGKFLNGKTSVENQTQSLESLEFLLNFLWNYLCQICKTKYLEPPISFQR